MFTNKRIVCKALAELPGFANINMDIGKINDSNVTLDPSTGATRVDETMDFLHTFQGTTLLITDSEHKLVSEYIRKLSAVWNPDTTYWGESGFEDLSHMGGLLRGLQLYLSDFLFRTCWQYINLPHETYVTTIRGKYKELGYPLPEIWHEQNDYPWTKLLEQLFVAVIDETTLGSTIQKFANVTLRDDNSLCTVSLVCACRAFLKLFDGKFDEANRIRRGIYQAICAINAFDDQE